MRGAGQGRRRRRRAGRRSAGPCSAPGAPEERTGRADPCSTPGAPEERTKRAGLPPAPAWRNAGERLHPATGRCPPRHPPSTCRQVPRWCRAGRTGRGRVSTLAPEFRRIRASRAGPGPWRHEGTLVFGEPSATSPCPPRHRGPTCADDATFTPVLFMERGSTTRRGAHRRPRSRQGRRRRFTSRGHRRGRRPGSGRPLRALSRPCKVGPSVSSGPTSAAEEVGMKIASEPPPGRAT